MLTNNHIVMSDQFAINTLHALFCIFAFGSGAVRCQQLLQRTSPKILDGF